MISELYFFNEFFQYLGLFALMFGAFLVGYISSWWLHKEKYRNIINKLKKEVNQLKTPKKLHDIETIFTEIRPKIIEVVKEAQDEKIVTISKEKVAQKARENYVAFTKSSSELNFDSFGYADFDDRQDLTEINGIGPYTEQKLNGIGFYTFDQISRFNEEDIKTVTELIDFFPGRIDHDNWIGQAKALLTV